LFLIPFTPVYVFALTSPVLYICQLRARVRITTYMTPLSMPSTMICPVLVKESQQGSKCQTQYHATTGRSRARRRRLGGSGPRGQPRAAAVSHVLALRGRGRRGACRPGRIPHRKLGPHFDCSYTHSPTVAGAVELTPCMAASGRCGAAARSRLNARGSTRTGVGSVAWHATGRLQGGASPGDTARLPRPDRRRLA
jgi:hypothetical protein